MSKRIALVGHCGPDSSYLRMAIKNAVKDATIVAADDDGELQQVIGEGVDLILFNRELGYGFTDGLGVDYIRRLRGARPALKMMLVSNYGDAQTAAVAAGALPGFGKRELGTKRVVELLRDAVVAEQGVEAKKAV
jgi:hypothetical protein